MANETTIGNVPGNDDCLGMVEDLLNKLRKGKITKTQFARFLKKENPFDSTITDKDEVLTVTVNRDRTIADGVAAGKYTYENDDINDTNFPISGSGTESTEIILVHFDKSISTELALAELEKRNLRPADAQELLVIGEQHPEKQRQFPIIALGSVWRNSCGYRCVPCLDRGGSFRKLSLYRDDCNWIVIYRFAAVRKQPKPVAA